MIRTRRSRSQHRGFTLAELMIVVAIIGVVASTVLMAMYGVLQDTKAQRTRSQVAKIDVYIMSRWEDYRTRPVPIDLPPGMVLRPVNNTWTPDNAAWWRLQALRELMRMEMPDRKTDLIDLPVVLPEAPSLWISMRRRVDRLYGISAPWEHPGPDNGWGIAGVDDNDDGVVDDPDEHGAINSDDIGWSREHQGAECLYLILSMMSDGDTSALDYFRESEIGDVDGDGMLEILDGWASPISWLRWPHGFTEFSAIQAARSADPFDPLQVDPRWPEFDGGTPNGNEPYLLYPLIYSGGIDRQKGIVADFKSPRQSNWLRYSQTSPALRNDPYYEETINGNLVRIGLPDISGGYADNITNHLSEVR